MIVNERILISDEAKVDLSAIWRVVWGYKYIIVLGTGFGGLLAAAFAFTATPVYQAEVVVTDVSNRSMSSAASLASQLGGLASLVGVSLGSGSSTSHEAQSLLNSRRLAEEFIERHKLIPTLFAHAEKKPSQWIAVKTFREGVLSIKEDVRKGTTTIAIAWTDSAIAALWANEYVALANELMRTHAIEEAKASIAYLNDQISHTNVVEVQRVMYSLIENETKTLMLANARNEYAFSVVDPAVPPEVRISPRRRLIVVLGLTLGCLLGICIAFSRNLWLRYKRDVLSSS